MNEITSNFNLFQSPAETVKEEVSFEGAQARRQRKIEADQAQAAQPRAIGIDAKTGQWSGDLFASFSGRATLENSQIYNETFNQINHTSGNNKNPVS